MENCFKIQLKGTANNDSLEKLGTFTLQTKSVGSPTINSQRLQIQVVSGQKVTITCGGDGYVNKVYERLNVDNFKSIELNATIDTFQSVFFSNGAYQIEISNKYAIKYWNIARDMVDMDVLYPLSQWEYCTGLTYFVANTFSWSGKLASLNKLTALQTLNLENNPNVNGYLKDLGNCTSLAVMQLNGAQIGGSIEDFVASQYDNGRTSVASSSAIQAYHILKYATLSGNNYDETYSFLMWENKNKIAVFAGNTSVATCTKVYTKGYTAEEAATAFPGKTIIRTDE